jgi:F-type H+-transporting ATPase subunit epsilon
MALPTSIELQIVTPDRLVLKENVDEVEIPGSEGYFGVLPGHTPLLASLAIGELWYRQGQEKTYLSIAFGFAEVLPDRVTILARLAEKADDIDLERAEAALARAQKRLAGSQQDAVDYERARTALLKSLSRLNVSRIGVGARTGGMKRLRNQS